MSGAGVSLRLSTIPCPQLSPLPQRGRGAGGEGSPQRGRGAGGEVDWRERTLATPHVIHAMAARARYVPNETFLIRLLDMSTRFVVCLYSSWQGSYHF